MVGTPTLSRKQRFKRALIAAAMTQKQFCEQAGVTVQHLHAVLGGRRRSDTLTEKVDLFITEQETATVAAA